MKKNLLLMLVGILLLAGCGGASSDSSNTKEPLATIPAEYVGKTNPFGAEAVTDGAKVFKSNCEMCHGPQGHGDGPASSSFEPKPKNIAEFKERVDDDYLFWRISEGKPGTAMVAWKNILTEEQIWQVVSFIRTLE